jgi:hypothetical protein
VTCLSRRVLHWFPYGNKRKSKPVVAKITHAVKAWTAWFLWKRMHLPQAITTLAAARFSKSCRLTWFSKWPIQFHFITTVTLSVVLSYSPPYLVFNTFKPRITNILFWFKTLKHVGRIAERTNKAKFYVTWTKFIRLSGNRRNFMLLPSSVPGVSKSNAKLL